MMICAAVAVSSFVFMLAWNVFAHGVFDLPEIDMIKAFALLCVY